MQIVQKLNGKEMPDSPYSPCPRHLMHFSLPSRNFSLNSLVLGPEILVQ